MINNVVIVSGTQQSDSAIHICGSIQFYFFGERVERFRLHSSGQ